MPRWVAPPLVMVTSPQGAHDVLTSDDVDRTAAHDEIRHVLGPNLFDLPNAPLAPAAAHAAATVHQAPRLPLHAEGCAPLGVRTDAGSCPAGCLKPSLVTPPHPMVPDMPIYRAMGSSPYDDLVSGP